MSKKTLTISIISIIILALIGGGVVWYVKTQKQEFTPSDDLGTVNPAVTENEDRQSAIENQKSEIINTDDWLTYRNEEYRFEFKYPKEWILTDKYKQFNKYNIISIENFFTNKYKTNDGSIIKINIYTNVDNEKINDWLNKNYPIDLETSTLHESKNITVSSNNAVYRVITSNISGGYFNDITFIKNKTVYYIEIVERILSEEVEKTKEHNNIIDNIINSFHFIN